MLSSEEFVNLFNLPRDGYGSPIQLQDLKYGFSAYKEREEEGFKSLIRVYIENDDLENADANKAVTVTESYGKVNDDHGITVSSTNFKREIDWPVELSSTNEFYFNFEKRIFLFKNETVDPLDVLNKVDDLHTRPQRKIAGFWIRSQIRLQNITSKLIEFLFSVIAVIHFIFTNQKVKIFTNLNANLVSRDMYSVSKNQSEPLKPIEIFGVSVPQSLAILYSLFHLAAFALFYYKDFEPYFIKVVFENNFLTLMYVILTVGIAKKFMSDSDKSFHFLIPVLVWLKKLRFSTLVHKLHIKLK
jgi:hypothetical protein